MEGGGGGGEGLLFSGCRFPICAFCLSSSVFNY